MVKSLDEISLAFDGENLNGIPTDFRDADTWRSLLVGRKLVGFNDPWNDEHNEYPEAVLTELTDDVSCFLRLLFLPFSPAEYSFMYFLLILTLLCFGLDRRGWKSSPPVSCDTVWVPDARDAGRIPVSLKLPSFSRLLLEPFSLRPAY